MNFEMYVGKKEQRAEVLAVIRKALTEKGFEEFANNFVADKDDNGNIQPSIEMLVRLSKLFGVTTDYLLGLDDVKHLNMEGLSDTVIAHLHLLIEDFRTK